MEVQIGEFLISDEKLLVQADRVHELLKNTYWAENRSLEVVKKTIENSLCIGIYKNNLLVGFARCVTDYSVVYWLCDVIIDEKYRGQGLGKALMKVISEHNDLKFLRGILATKDAHGLYEQYGYIHDKDTFMRKM